MRGKLQMTYRSLIRIKDEDRKNRCTTLDKDLLKQIKLIAVEEDISYNFLLEDGMRHILEEFKGRHNVIIVKSKNRKTVNTTFSDDLYSRVQVRAERLGVKTNDLIEEGMRYIIGRNTEKDME